MSDAIPFIDLKAQYNVLKADIDVRIQKVLDHGQYIMGPEVSELEKVLSDYVGVSHCITASSGTDTLMMALMALGVGAGDEVITSPFSFVASAEVIALLGAIPVFVDIDPLTFNVVPSEIEAAITGKTKAIIPVSLFGQCADFDEINAVAVRHGVPVIEDGAQSFGGLYKGRKSCGLSEVGSTSFFPSKPLGCYGDGGALFTNDEQLAEALKEIRVHGQSQRYHHPRIGINARLDTLQAAILLAKMNRFDEEVEARQEVARRYGELIREHCLDIILPEVAETNRSVFAQYTVRVKHRDIIRQFMIANGIPVAVHYPVPINRQPAYSRYAKSKNTPMSDRVATEVLSLPMGPDLREEAQIRIVEVLACAQKHALTTPTESAVKK